MAGDHHGQTAGMATLLVRPVDEILGTHRPDDLGVAGHAGLHGGDREGPETEQAEGEDDPARPRSGPAALRWRLGRRRVGAAVTARRRPEG